MSIDGTCSSSFRLVREEFERNFAERKELGASVCVTLAGETVVDLWGGIADRYTGRPWERHTLVLAWSCTKGAVALCAHVLHARGLVDYDAPVARYWPEFAQAGKESIPVRLLLNHQAGVPAIRTRLRAGGLYDWKYITDLLAAQAPFWPPGTRHGYHAQTFGHLVGEVVQRCAGVPLGQFFHKDIAGPLGIDFYLGLPEGLEERVAPITRADPTPAGEALPVSERVMSADPESLQALAFLNSGRRTGTRDYDSPEAHRAVLPSQGAIANARGLAGMYMPLAVGGEAADVRLVDRDTLAEMSAVSSAGASDAVLLIGTRFSLGFWKSVDNRKSPPGARDSVIMSEAAFGHPGMGGSIGFADPVAGMSFGYAMNKQGRGVGLNERGQALIDAVYRSLGYRDNRSGRWVK
jgi:CubicO group peptidase (beta-lactamase class C family)